MSEVPKHIQRAYKKVAAQNALADALAGRPADPTGKRTYQRSYTAAARGIGLALRGLKLTQRERERSLVAAEAFDIVDNLKKVIGGGDTFAMLLAASNVVSPKRGAVPVEVPKLVTPSGETAEPEEAGPTHGQVGHKQKVGADTWVEVVGYNGTPTALWCHMGKPRKRKDEIVYEREASFSIDEVPTANSPDWVRMYWDEVYLGRDYSRSDPNESLKKLSIYETILDRMVGDAIEFGDDEPGRCPDNAHPRIKEYWAACALGIRDEIEGGSGEITPARRAGAVYARKRELRGIVRWDETAQRFGWTNEYKKTFDNERSAS